MAIDRGGASGLLQRAAVEAEERLHLARLNLGAAAKQLGEDPDDEGVWTWVEAATREVRHAEAVNQEMKS